MVVTPHGLINEQLAALLPNHSEDGTLDAQFAAHWAGTNPRHQHEAELAPFAHKPNFKRSYTFGTDNSFNNPTGFAASHAQEHDRVGSRQSQHDLDHTQFLVRSIVGVPEPDTALVPPIAGLSARRAALSDEERSDDVTSDDEASDRPAKKRRKSKHRISKDSPRKMARSTKTRKVSFAEENSRKKRASAAAQKLQRENLTEEQKRSNHILSEQKRRNLIKRGFDDLHDLVPAIRNGGLSKSSVLLEAGNFLDKLIQDNHVFLRLTGGVAGASSE